MSLPTDMRVYAGAFLVLCLLVGVALLELGHAPIAMVFMVVAFVLAALSGLALLALWVFSRDWAP